MLKLYNTRIEEDEIQLQQWGLLPASTSNSSDNSSNRIVDTNTINSMNTVFTGLTISSTTTDTGSINSITSTTATAVPTPLMTQSSNTHIFIVPEERLKQSVIMVYTEKKVLKSVLVLILRHYYSIFGESLK